MSRKRLTQVFPGLLPLRLWQRKKMFYMKMKLDTNRYARKTSYKLLPQTVFETSSLMLNENSGFDIKYQHNKIHNLKLAAKKINKIIIEPNETFSFWQLARLADQHEPYKDGLALVNEKITGSYGGGLCQLSNMLFWMFLHTPMTIIERHGHAIKYFPSTDEDGICGIDATINEGWLDLKVKNKTDQTFQIVLGFDDKYMYGKILSQRETGFRYEIINDSVSYVKKKDTIYQIASVARKKINVHTDEMIFEPLYVNKCGIGYELPKGIQILERN